ncbi:MAG: ABC transporter permease [Candidatus Aminicenantes bacterium]|nr:ABC transporter permease [Candidatus Aminicenantes bacterium]
MRKLLRLAKREYLASVKTKGFIIMLVLMPVLMGGSGVAMYLLRNQVDTTDKKVAVLDRSGVIANVLLAAAKERNDTAVFDKESGKKIQPAYIFEIVSPDNTNPEGQKLELSNRIDDGDLHAFLDIGPNVLNLKGEKDTFLMTYHAKNAAMDNIRTWLNNTINNHLRLTRMKDAGLDDSQADEILTWIQVEAMGLVSVDEATGEIQAARKASEAEALLVPMILFFLMFMMVMMGAMPLLQSTMEEKTQRIAEVLLGSLTPFEFMGGKVLGGLGVSLTGTLFYLSGGILLVSKMGMADFIPFHIIPWFLIFLIFEIIMVGSMLAALGSACNDPKDAQNLTYPAMIPVMFPMFVFMPILQEPTSGFATWMSLFPPFTPMLMLLRKAAPVDIPTWQPWVGLAGVLLFTVLAVWVGGRIFRVGILMQGGAPKIGKIFHWAFRG